MSGPENVEVRFVSAIFEDPGRISQALGLLHHVRLNSHDTERLVFSLYNGNWSSLGSSWLLPQGTTILQAEKSIHKLLEAPSAQKIGSNTDDFIRRAVQTHHDKQRELIDACLKPLGAAPYPDIKILFVGSIEEKIGRGLQSKVHLIHFYQQADEKNGVYLSTVRSGSVFDPLLARVIQPPPDLPPQLKKQPKVFPRWQAEKITPCSTECLVSCGLARLPMPVLVSLLYAERKHKALAQSQTKPKKPPSAHKKQKIETTGTGLGSNT